MHHRIYILVATVIAALAFAGASTPAQADKRVTVKKRVCDRWTHKSKAMRGTDLIKISMRVDFRPFTYVDRDEVVSFGYASNTSFTISTPRRKQRARTVFRFVSMDEQCHRVALRYRIHRFDPKTSPYS